MTEREKLAARADGLHEMADGLSDVPDVDLVRWVTPEEWPSAQVLCVQGLGFDVSLSGDGTGLMRGDVPSSQESALALAMYTCYAEYFVDPEYQKALDDEQRGILYEYFVDFYIPCVQGLGYQVGEPPSKEVFVATAADQAWSPAGDIEALRLPSEERAKVELACPQSPPSAVLYGT